MDHIEKQPKKYCFTRNHMTMRQYGLYSVVRELQSKWGFVYFDGDDLSASFKKTSRDVIYDDCKVLVETGWLEEVGKRNRKKDGTYEARKLTALTHKEWVAKYPSKCRDLKPNQLANSLTVQLANSDSPVGNQRLTSRLLAIDQSLPTNKDLVQGSKVQPKTVQGRQTAETVENDEEVFDRTEREEESGKEHTTSPATLPHDKELPACKCGGKVAWGDPHKQTNPICLSCGKPPTPVAVAVEGECLECGDPCPAGQGCCDDCVQAENRRTTIGAGNGYVCTACGVLRGWSKWRDRKVLNSPRGTLRCPECDVAVVPREATPEEYGMALNGGNYVEV
jgi:hypothetical protein